jgi:hypothetical protein
MLDTILNYLLGQKTEDDKPLYTFDFSDNYDWSLDQVILEAEKSMHRGNELLFCDMPMKITLANVQKCDKMKVYTFEVWKR